MKKLAFISAAMVAAALVALAADTTSRGYHRIEKANADKPAQLRDNINEAIDAINTDMAAVVAASNAVNTRLAGATWIIVSSTQLAYRVGSVTNVVDADTTTAGLQ